MLRESDTGSHKSTAAWRVSSSCPACGAELAIRDNRIDGSRFVACSGFPRCRFSEALDDALEALAARIAELEDALLVAPAGTNALPASVISKELIGLIYRFHPDRRREPIPPHEVVAELTRLRARVVA